jgi:hypothetical protein
MRARDQTLAAYSTIKMVIGGALSAVVHLEPLLDRLSSMVLN